MGTFRIRSFAALVGLALALQAGPACTARAKGTYRLRCENRPAFANLQSHQGIE